MEKIISSLIDNSAMPILTAFLLGLLTIISPCPFCSDITAVGYIGKDVSSKTTVLKNGVLYAIGKIATYWGLSFIFILGGDIQPIQNFLEKYGERALGPFFIICASLILVFSYREKRHHKCHCGHDHQCHCGESHHHYNNGLVEKIMHQIPYNSWVGAFIIGLIGSLAFCPYTSVLYFGVLIPMTISQPIGLNWLLPLSFAIATVVPVLVITILFMYGAVSISRINTHIHKLEVYLRYFCISIFLCVGLFLIISTSGGHHHDHGNHHVHYIENIQNYD